MKPGRKPKIAAVESPVVDNAAQAYAMRVWGGQSVDVPVRERVMRVLNGLLGQKMSLDINLPDPSAARFISELQEIFRKSQASSK